MINNKAKTASLNQLTVKNAEDFSELVKQVEKVNHEERKERKRVKKKMNIA